MHSAYRRLYEQRPGRQRTVFNINRQHGVNGVIDAATGPPIAPDQVLTGAQIYHNPGLNANNEALGVTSHPLAGPLAEFPQLEPSHAIYTTGNQVGLRAATAVYGSNGTCPVFNFPLHNKEGFVVVLNDASTFIQTAATLTTRTRTPDETATAQPKATRVLAFQDADQQRPPGPPRDMFGTLIGIGPVVSAQAAANRAAQAAPAPSRYKGFRAFFPLAIAR